MYFTNMRSLHLLPLFVLLASALADSRGPPAPAANVPPKVEPTKLDNFTWADPFSSRKDHQFYPACESFRTFSASEFQLHDLSEPEPEGLLPYREPLMASFYGRPYPGGWNGIDAHGYERNLLKMEYQEVPTQVREWIEVQERVEGPGKGLFAVFTKAGVSETTDADEKIVVFAPGALYETLPLWVSQDSGCEGMLFETHSGVAKQGSNVDLVR